MVITMASYALQTPPRVAHAKPPWPKYISTRILGHYAPLYPSPCWRLGGLNGVGFSWAVTKIQMWLLRLKTNNWFSLSKEFFLNQPILYCMFQVWRTKKPRTLALKTGLRPDRLYPDIGLSFEFENFCLWIRSCIKFSNLVKLQTMFIYLQWKILCYG